MSSKRVRGIFGGAPWEVPENYLKNSALFHCREATIPTLFLMGNAEKGGADPYDTVHILTNALKAQDVETEYVKYTDEGHFFEQIVNQRDALERSIRWIDGRM
jgi:dipeptidyl aminopeptidase/acylaminoacyl peptidase